MDHFKGLRPAAHDTLTHAEMVSKAELRPWVKIDVIPHGVEVGEFGSLSLRCDIICENVGSTVARSVCIYWDYDLAQDGFPALAEKYRAQWWAQKADNGNVLMPGEVATIPFEVFLHQSVVPWEVLFDSKFVWPRMTIAAFYKSDVDPKWKQSFRNFSIGKGDGPLGVFGVGLKAGKMVPPELTAKSYGLSVAT
jgi:hypothetical protein